MKRFLGELIAVARRELLYILRDSRLRTVVLIAPFLYAALFCAVYIQHTLYDVPVGILLEDHSAPTRTLTRMFESSAKVNLAYRAQSVEELKELMLAGKIDAAVVVPRDFTVNLKRGRRATVVCYVNAAAMVPANIAAKALNEVVQTFSAGVEIRTLMKKGDRLETARQRFMPVAMDMRPMFNPSFNYSNFMIPGLLVAILQQVILLGVALSWTGEKEFGTLGELFRLSKSPAALMIGKALPYLVINGIVAEIYLRVVFPLNDIPMEGSWRLAVPFTFLFILTVVSLGMWVSGLCRTRLFATQVLMLIASPSFVLSGFTWPTHAMPGFIQALGQMLPMTHFVTSFRSIYLAGAPAHYALREIGVLAGFAAVNILLTWWVVRRLVNASEGETTPAS